MGVRREEGQASGRERCWKNSSKEMRRRGKINCDYLDEEVREELREEKGKERTKQADNTIRAQKRKK